MNVDVLYLGYLHFIWYPIQISLIILENRQLTQRVPCTSSIFPAGFVSLILFMFDFSILLFFFLIYFYLLSLLLLWFFVFGLSCLRTPSETRVTCADQCLQSHRSADCLTLRMTHFAGKSRGKRKHCTWSNNVRKKISIYSSKIPQDGYTATCHYLIEYIWPKPEGRSGKKAKWGKDCKTYASRTYVRDEFAQFISIFASHWLF